MGALVISMVKVAPPNPTDRMGFDSLRGWYGGSFYTLAPGERGAFQVGKE